MKTYKDFSKKYIGQSDIASLILVGCSESGLKLKELHFGMDGEYYTYIVEGEDVEIGNHYWLVDTFTDWIKIYDDNERTFYRVASKINVYRASEMGCIIQLISEEEKYDVAEEGNVSAIISNDGTEVSIIGSGTLSVKRFKELNCNHMKINIVDPISFPEDCTGLFFNCTKEIIINPDINTSKVKSMKNMFCCAVKANPNVSKWDVSNVKNMENIFDGARNAKPNVSKWQLNPNVLMDEETRTLFM